MANVRSQGVYNDRATTSSVPLPLSADGTPAVNPAAGQPYASVVFTATVNQTDAADASKAVRGSVLANYDDETFVTFEAGAFEWSGGTRDHRNPSLYAVPSLNISLPARTNPDGSLQYPRAFAVVLDTLGNSINYGVTLDVV